MLLLDLSAMVRLDLELISSLVDSIPVRNMSFSYLEFPSSKPLSVRIDLTKLRTNLT